MAAQSPTVPVKSPTVAPTQKVAAGGLGGAVSVIVIAILQHYAKLDIDPTLASAITTIVSFLVAYIVPPSSRDTPIPA
jgi:hypothetical protein